jgi:hypothetical protein
MDRDDSLLRWDASYVADVWWPPRAGEPGTWSRTLIEPVTASVTAITSARAQEIAGADLYADASAEAWGAARTGSSS